MQRVSEYPTFLLTIYRSSVGKTWHRSAIKSAVAKACGHTKAAPQSCAGDAV